MEPFSCLNAGDVTDNMQLLPANWQRIFIN